MVKLEQTKSQFKLIGKVNRIEKDGAFKVGEGKEGTKNAGKASRSLRFSVRTSDNNEVFVNMFAYEPEQVFLWNSKKKEKDSSYKGDRIPFADWETNKERYREEGYACLQARVGVDYKEVEQDGKTVTKLDSQGMTSYEAMEVIYESLMNDDSVAIEGDVRYSNYEKDGKVVEQKQFNITKLHRVKDVDFDADDFEEVSYFEQEFVLVDSEIDKAEKKAYVTGRIIDYRENFHDTQFVVDYSDGNGGNDTSMVKLAEALTKKVKFGDVMQVFGDVENRLITIDVEDEEEDDDDLDIFGGKSKPKHAQKWNSGIRVSEMRILGVDGWDKAVYKEDDFFKAKEENTLFEEDKEDDIFGGKKKKKIEDDPFADDGVDISDDDLPF